MWNRAEVELIDVLEVRWIACEKWEIVRDRDRRDHGVVGPCPRLSASTMQGRSDSAKGASRSGVEWKRIEIGLSLLEAHLPGGPFGWICCHQWAHGKLGQRHCCDDWLSGKA